MGDFSSSENYKMFSLNSNPKLKKPFKYGWRREIVIRKTRKHGQCKSTDTYYHFKVDKSTSVKARSKNDVEMILTMYHEKNKFLSTDNFNFNGKLLGDPYHEVIREAGVKKPIYRFKALRDSVSTKKLIVNVERLPLSLLRGRKIITDFISEEMLQDCTKLEENIASEEYNNCNKNQYHKFLDQMRDNEAMSNDKYKDCNEKQTYRLHSKICEKEAVLRDHNYVEISNKNCNSTCQNHMNQEKDILNDECQDYDQEDTYRLQNEICEEEAISIDHKYKDHNEINNSMLQNQICEEAIFSVKNEVYNQKPNHSLQDQVYEEETVFSDDKYEGLNNRTYSDLKLHLNPVVLLSPLKISVLNKRIVTDFLSEEDLLQVPRKKNLFKKSKNINKRHASKRQTKTYTKNYFPEMKIAHIKQENKENEITGDYNNGLQFSTQIKENEDYRFNDGYQMNTQVSNSNLTIFDNWIDPYKNDNSDIEFLDTDISSYMLTKDCYPSCNDYFKDTCFERNEISSLSEPDCQSIIADKNEILWDTESHLKHDNNTQKCICGYFENDGHICDFTKLTNYDTMDYPIFYTKNKDLCSTEYSFLDKTNTNNNNEGNRPKSINVSCSPADICDL